MEKLRQQVARAQRRLILGQFFAALAWCWTAALVVAAIGLAVAKLFPLNVDGRIWAVAWIGGAAPRLAPSPPRFGPGSLVAIRYLPRSKSIAGSV